MKEFKTVRDAFDYLNYCVICGGNMENVSDTISIIVNIPGTYIDTMRLNVNNNEFVFCIKGREQPSYQNVPLFAGVVSVSYGGYCRECNKYSYTLKIDFRADKRYIDNVSLISESISLEVKEALYEIRNSYGTNKTEYSCFVGAGDKIKSSLPLVTDNVNNPYELLDRIKKLIVFS